jgi:hypothetical protein
MSSSNEMLIRSLLDECLGTTLDTAYIAYLFKRGHLSPEINGNLAPYHVKVCAVVRV